MRRNIVLELGHRGVHYGISLGRSGIFLWQTVIRWPQPTRSFPLLIQQIYSVGAMSLSIIMLSALFIGAVVALQGFNTLEKFSAEQELGQLLALSVVRELGPVVAALLYAGRSCSALTAEIGLMKATEQLDSLDMMGVDPLHFVVAPRFWAGFISLPMLVLVFDAMAIFGGYLIGVEWLGVDQGSFWNNMQSSVDFHIDVMSGFYKGVVFAIVTTWIAVYQGFAALPTAEGVGRATTRTVVYASLAVLGLDFILTAVMLGGW